MNGLLGKKLEQIRIEKVLPFIKGNLIDVGCGNNMLTKTYGKGTGVDVHDWGDVDIIVDDTSKIPLDNNTFDTTTIIAALNHIPNRGDVIKEYLRLLKDDGKMIITMIPPTISTIWHVLRKPWGVDQSERGMKEGEVYGMKKNDIINCLKTMVLN